MSIAVQGADAPTEDASMPSGALETLGRTSRSCAKGSFRVLWQAPRAGPKFLGWAKHAQAKHLSSAGAPAE